MKKLVLFCALALVLFLPGCVGGSAKDLMSQIPDNRFKKFEYHRGGVWSSAHIVAREGEKREGRLEVEAINMTLNYGPESLTISLEGYQREIVPADNGEE